MKCEFCNQEQTITLFFPPSIKEWFFAYCKCDCGRFLIERELLEEKLAREKYEKEEKEKQEDHIQEGEKGIEGSSSHSFLA